MSAEAEIIRRIRERGRITFAEYMETALYWPDGGYYTTTEPGAEGDFYTAPQAHPAFGSLIALQLFQMWDILDRPRPFWTVEMGAGNGRLCHDVMSFSLQLPGDFSSALHYVCIDRAARQGLEGDLPSDLRDNVDRLVSHTVPLKNVVGCFLSNELPDAFPVHRVTMEGGELREIFVTEDPDGALVEETGESSTVALTQHLEALGVRLEEGQRAEINLELGPWMKAVSDALPPGLHHHYRLWRLGAGTLFRGPQTGNAVGPLQTHAGRGPVAADGPPGPHCPRGLLDHRTPRPDTRAYAHWNHYAAAILK